MEGIIQCLFEWRQFFALVFGAIFLLPMAFSPPYGQNIQIRCPPDGILYLWAIGVALSMAITPEYLLIGDKLRYAEHFSRIAANLISWVDSAKDPLFFGWMKLVSFFTSSSTSFFIVTALAYILGYIIALRRIGGKYWSVLFIAAVFSLGFFSYGASGLRAGLGYAFLLLSISFFSQRKIWAVCFGLLAFGMHASMLIPLTALSIAYFYKNTRVIFFGWLVLLLISALFGDITQKFLGSFFESWEDQRMVSYAIAENSRYNQGFRIDFLLYGFIPILMGLYYKIKEKFVDVFYVWILNTYIITNGFWLLMIRAVYTDRFAYLSWGLIPLILFYPLLKKRIWVNQNFCIPGGLFLLLLLDVVLASRELLEF